jgi:hypothetical protein
LGCTEWSLLNLAVAQALERGHFGVAHLVRPVGSGEDVTSILSFFRSFMWRIGLAHCGVCLQVSGALLVSGAGHGVFSALGWSQEF